MLDAVRATGGTAVAVTDTDLLAAQRAPARDEGTWVCPEGAACFAAVGRLRETGWLDGTEDVVVLNTGTGLIYPDTVPVDVPTLPRDGVIPRHRADPALWTARPRRRTGWSTWVLLVRVPDRIRSGHTNEEDGQVDGPLTLAIDIGGSGCKAVVLSPDGEMLSERVRRETPYPCTPPALLDELAELAAAQPAHDRVSVGFPGAIRRGRVREVPAFSRRGPGQDPDPELLALWTGYELETALADRFGKPVRVANDADVQGCAVIEGRGLELVVTLGTGVGCAVFFDGALLPHMELSHGRFGEGLSIEVACGDNQRQEIGKEAWRERVLNALEALESMVLPDHVFVGGGNAKKLDLDTIGPNRTLIPNVSGLLGGIALWDRTTDAGLDRAPAPVRT